MKILVGCPTSDHKAYCLKEYAAGIKGMEGKFDVLIADNSKTEDYSKEIEKAGLPVIRGPYLEKARDRLVTCRNMLRKKVLDEGYDWFFSLEQDVIPPPDVLTKLLAHNKRIVGGVYTKEYNLIQNDKKIGTRELPLLWMIHNGAFTQMEMADLQPERLQQVIACGLGCLLIHRSVLEKISFRWDPLKKGFDDSFFCTDVQRFKFGVFADTSVRCDHLEMSWDGIEK